MASSNNKHWPSMFKSKQCNTHHRKAPLSSGGEKWTPEPKQRWNPKPEQIRILEAIFNSGMINPPREEITKIRGQLEEYGKVGDANVFYWFQNRKSRTKHKHRQRYNLNNQNPKNQTPPPSPPILDTINSNIAPVNHDLHYNYVQQQEMMMNNNDLSQGFGFPELLNNGVQVVDHVYDNQGINDIGCSSNLLFTDLMMIMSSNGGGLEANDQHLHVPNSLIDTSMTTTTIDHTAPLSVNQQLQGVDLYDGVGPLVSNTSTVFINEVPFEVAVGSINLRECFGDDSVLLHSTGHPVLTNECGVTLQPLQHGALYYLI